MHTHRYSALIPFVFVLVITSPALLLPKAESLLLINGLHNSLLDVFFKYFTWLGEAVLVIFCAILVFFLQKRWFLVFCIGLGIHIFLIQCNKQLLFNDVYRPAVYMKTLGQDDLIHFVKGVKIRREVSFPSGHTTGATFAVSFLALLVNRGYFSIAMAIIATLVGISRVYLAQHFVVDVYFGLLFGLLSTAIAYFIAKRRHGDQLWMHTFVLPRLNNYIKKIKFLPSPIKDASSSVF